MSTNKYPKTMYFQFISGGKFHNCSGVVNNIFEEQKVLNEINILRGNRVKITKENTETFCKLFPMITNFSIKEVI
ncbi:hypothetical protein KGF86_01845 [Ornithinibacillus massiliensis]|uniref:Uncharacterized protein n=1 Tax=Ornithinibacillus massiliensis TaxID=1944633 RepID=A0ABS5MAH4_9BACI|nr:hypothetical protein [Ornithinibacillus massiliensis]MBS3678947.1 hypothetical protein [Ornithinibacillus massiliensis]